MSGNKSERFITDFFTETEGFSTMCYKTTEIFSILIEIIVNSSKTGVSVILLDTFQLSRSKIEDSKNISFSRDKTQFFNSTQHLTMNPIYIKFLGILV